MADAVQRGDLIVEKEGQRVGDAATLEGLLKEAVAEQLRRLAASALLTG